MPRILSLRETVARDHNPYPGLASFKEVDAEFFFGREIEIESIWTKLKLSTRPKNCSLHG